MAQVPNEWWDQPDAVEPFQLLIASAMRIHINNVLRCSTDEHLNNIPALNEVKSLDYITQHLQIPNINSTNFANEIEINSNTTSSRSSNRRFRGRGGRGGRGGSTRFARF